MSYQIVAYELPNAAYRITKNNISVTKRGCGQGPRLIAPPGLDGPACCGRLQDAPTSRTCPTGPLNVIRCTASRCSSRRALLVRLATALALAVTLSAHPTAVHTAFAYSRRADSGRPRDRLDRAQLHGDYHRFLTAYNAWLSH